MAESNENASEGKQPPKRRASDRGVPEQGNQGGGRRSGDNQRSLPRSNAAKIAIACSFFFSTGLVAWAFTLPFRPGGIGESVATADLTEAELMKLEYEARLSPAEYVEYARDIDRRLLEELRARDQQSKKAPTKRELYQNWKSKTERREKTIKALRANLGEEKEFVEGTVEWQYEQDIEKVISDAPLEP